MRGARGESSRSRDAAAQSSTVTSGMASRTTMSRRTAAAALSQHFRLFYAAPLASDRSTWCSSPLSQSLCHRPLVSCNTAPAHVRPPALCSLFSFFPPKHPANSRLTGTMPIPPCPLASLHPAPCISHPPAAVRESTCRPFLCQGTISAEGLAALAYARKFLCRASRRDG